ncbi:MAG: hypothetical protein WCE82_03335 [Halobacteriota archaeon]
MNRTRIVPLAFIVTIVLLLAMPLAVSATPLSPTQAPASRYTMVNQQITDSVTRLIHGFLSKSLQNPNEIFSGNALAEMLAELKGIVQGLLP